MRFVRAEYVTNLYIQRLAWTKLRQAETRQLTITHFVRLARGIVGLLIAETKVGIIVTGDLCSK